MSQITWQLLLCVGLLMSVCEAWHDLTNADFHCWPLTASEASPATTGSCPGLDMHWLQAPPSSIKAEEDFNVTYQLLLDDSFYDWAISNSFFSSVGITNSTLAQDWCESVDCPTDKSSVDSTTCCIHHVNVHSCPLTSSSFCGPWIQATGETYTHSSVLWGNALVGNWTSLIGGLYVEGTTEMIAHLKIADMQVALSAQIDVLPRSECGNDICEAEDGEDCSTCPADCGSCPFSMETWQIAIIAVGGSIIVFGLGIFIAYYVYKQRKMLWDESWIIPYDDILAALSKKANFGSTMSLGASSNGSMKSGPNGPSGGPSSGMQQSAANRQLFTKVTVVRGKTVAVREVNKKQFSLTKQVRSEVKAVRSLDHQNICKFIGACIEVPHVCILMEYCPKGSLADVLQNPDVPLTWPFRFSFASDVARGMNQIYINNLRHGNLSSNNCVIDDRWTVKITDFGIPCLRSEDLDSKSDNQSALDDAMYKERQMRVYRPPEAKEKGFVAGHEADVYAFSIILVELATRNDPYGDEDTYDLPEDWKPPLPDLSADLDSPDNACPTPRQFLQLIQTCWQDRPSDRPSFELVKKTLQKINPNRQSAVDLMMNMMEKYSKHLESIVTERTSDLIQEKQKTDRLLYSMLPRPVADELRQGKAIGAEQFEACTIYFSDIVGFTNISGGSTPFQVVALLNKLYTCFDSVIEKYDVYKVETIGDAYMVVSGVPEKNGNQHAYEIAGMAVDLVAESKEFIIPHMPKEPLKIRVGLHSGSVCAGVVGLKMPRYCLFGDTVNTASRMESNGEPYKIHLSNFTYDVLQKTGGFRFDCRGVIAVKGKGDMKTWWLTERLPVPKDKHKLAELPGQPSEDVTCKSQSPGMKPLDLGNGPQRKISNSNDSGYNEIGEALDVALLGTPDTRERLTPVQDI